MHYLSDLTCGAFTIQFHFNNNNNNNEYRFSKILLTLNLMT